MSLWTFTSRNSPSAIVPKWPAENDRSGHNSKFSCSGVSVSRSWTPSKIPTVFFLLAHLGKHVAPCKATGKLWAAALSRKESLDFLGPRGEVQCKPSCKTTTGIERSLQSLQRGCRNWRTKVMSSNARLWGSEANRKSGATPSYLLLVCGDGRDLTTDL